MRIVICAAITSLLVASVPTSAADQPVISLARTSKWEIKYNPDSCQLLAGFGSSEQRVIFVLTREQPGDWFDLQLFGRPLKYGETDMPVELTFEPDGKPTKNRGISLTMSGGEKLPVVRLHGLRLDGWDDWKHPELIRPVTPARESAITAIGFKPAGGKRYRLETGSMGAPMAAVRSCTDDLIKTWGYDPAVEASLQRRPAPIGSPASWLRTEDYPTKSLAQGHNGLVRYRLDVDPAGMPIGCRVLYRTNPDEFADTTCKLLVQRARFAPALDGAGKPVKSFYTGDVRWMAGAY